MKRIFFLLPLLMLLKTGSAQEFVFSMYFEDAAGNRDTLVLGYDINATDSIDDTFGEINIISQAWDEDFDVRVTNSHYSVNPGPHTMYHTKKQIIKNSCGFDYSVLPVLTIDIKSNNWPVVATWDSTLFIENCLDFSDYASYPFWEGWDVLRPNDFDIQLKSQSEVSATNEEYPYSNLTYYLNEDNDTIRVFYMGLDDEQITVNIENEKPDEYNFDVYNDKELLSVRTDNVLINNVEIFDISGKLLKCEKGKIIDISDLPEGIYLCRILFDSNKIKTIKFVK